MHVRRTKTSLARWHKCERWPFIQCPFEEFEEGEEEDERRDKEPVEIDLPIPIDWPQEVWEEIIKPEDLTVPDDIPYITKKPKEKPDEHTQPTEIPGPGPVPIPFPVPGKDPRPREDPRPEEFPKPVAAFDLDQYKPEVWEVSSPMAPAGRRQPFYHQPRNEEQPNYLPPGLPRSLPPLTAPELAKNSRRSAQPRLQPGMAFADLGIMEELLSWAFSQLDRQLIRSGVTGATTTPSTQRRNSPPPWIAAAVGSLILTGGAALAGRQFRKGGGGIMKQNWTRIINGMSGRTAIVQPSSSRTRQRSGGLGEAGDIVG